ncbi:MAG: glutamate synthase subunit beta [Deltaproteobacteria bacterium]|jgi:glutamate synthase (NADPH/NADH) small chain|nr:glutamate synthase subunit beta [Deltaproteobacteria bacterium]
MKKYRPVMERIHDFKPVELLPGEGTLRDDLARCQDCGIPFCHACGCPLGNAIPEINAAALYGRWNTALSRLLATSPFPEFTSRVCPALCEGACVQSLHGMAVPCRRVELAVIERGFTENMLRPRPPAQRLTLRAAVIGSGPAGLAAAWRLNRAGLRVTVYEKDARPGGFLRYGIPDFKLEKKILDRRVRLMEEEGVEFECGVEAGADISGRLLQSRHALVLLATGARRKRDLPVPGRELGGVHFATDYLTAQNRLLAGEINSLPPHCNAAGKRVVVIGGGDTGSDCVGTAWRQGAVSVCQLEIMPKPSETRESSNPWPEWPRILRSSSSHEEGGERRWRVSAQAFVPAEEDPALLGAVLCHEVGWNKKDGRMSPVPKQGSEFTLPAGMALLAMGFTGTEDSPLLSSLGLTLDPAERLPRDAAGRLPGRNLYACGDAAAGPSLVVRAIADGLRVAECALEDLRAISL